MKIFMYDHFPNYGDVLNKHIWPLYFGKFLERRDDLLMFGIGTLLGQKIEHEGRVIVCGSGCGYEPDVQRVAQYKVFFVRGPNSARLLGLPPETAITDPAILVDECFPPVPRTDKVVFIPHWETSRNPLWKRVCAMAGIDYIDPLADVVTVSNQLSSAKLVIAEAMHGAIVADAYRVPWIPVSTSARINLFKWHDWAASLQLKPVFRTLAPLGMSDIFRSLTGDAKTAKKLREELAQGGDVIPSAASDGIGAKLCNGLNLLYNTLVPLKLRYKIDHRLMWKTGPWIDQMTENAAAKGANFARLKRSADELRRIAQEPGFLSEDAVCAAQRAKVKAKLGEVQQWLENN